MKQFFESVIDLHKKAFTEGVVPSTAVLYMIKNEKITVSPIISKASPANYVKEVVNHFVPDAYMFCAESWMKKATKEEVEKFIPGTIKDDPKREEVLVCYGRTIDGKTKYDRMFEIKREKGIELIERKVEKSGFQSTKMP